MKKFLTVLMMVFGIAVTFTACNSTLEEPGKTIAIYNSGSTTLVVIPVDGVESKNENTDEAIMLYPKRVVKMTFSAEYDYLWFAVNPTIYKTDTGVVVISGSRYYLTGISEGYCYNAWLKSNGYVDCFRSRVSEEDMESFPEGKLAKDTIVEVD
jgi:hypothetical protein